MPRSILYHNEDNSIIIIDGPASVEEAQVPSESLESVRNGMRLISTGPLEQPFGLPESRSESNSVDLALELVNLKTQRQIESALCALRTYFSGPWCLPRVVCLVEEKSPCKAKERALIPLGSRYLNGSISSQRECFLQDAPQFELVILDPPWPNRSARRKRGADRYQTQTQIDELLAQIPIPAKLAPHGLVAVWITNSSSCRSTLLDRRKGLLAQWGLELVDEWTWLKMTIRGEPIFDVGSSTRKPWEKLLLAKRIRNAHEWKRQDKLIISVPEVHSRKPNLRSVFSDLLPEDAKVLEVFARNLTARWWSWGDEVLKYQQAQHWVKDVEVKETALVP